MLAYQFNTTAENGFILIPDEYKSKIGAKIKVTVINEESYPLDDYDYQLAKEADEDTDTETVSFDDVLLACGLTYEDLQN